MYPLRLQMRSPRGEEAQRLLGSCSASCTRPASNRVPATTEIVVLKVELHCEGCARRVKKAICKLEGVDSYDIDMGSQKVTVVGKVSPKTVLERVTKINAAEFWPNANLGHSMVNASQSSGFTLAPV